MRKRLSIGFLVISAFIALFGFAVSCGSAPYIPELTGIYAADVWIRFDGGAHSITVDNILDGDEVYYSLSETGPWRLQNITFTMPCETTVYYKVVREGCDDFISSATIAIEKSVLSGIYADDASFIYDGQPHGITVCGLTDDERVLYSADGENFTAELTFTEAGEYKVFYRVENAYGEYADDCTVRIYPNIFGTYVNFERGVIVLDEFSATVFGETQAFTYDVTGAGNIGGVPFSVSESLDVLTFDGAEYYKLSADLFIYEITANDVTVYATADDRAEITVTFDGDDANVSVAGSSFTVAGVNYCDSVSGGVIKRKHFDQEVAIEVAAVSRQTQIKLELSHRERLSVDIAPTVILFDGNAHELEFKLEGVSVHYKTDDGYSVKPPSYTETGRYSAEVLLISDGYFPQRAELVMEIVPDYTGIYYTNDRVLEIDGASAVLNQKEQSFEPSNGEWLLNGKPVSMVDGALVADGVSFARFDGDGLIVILDIEGSITIAADAVNLEIRSYGDSLTVSVDRQDGFIELDNYGEAVVYVNGEQITGSALNGYVSYIVTKTEFSSRAVIYVRVETA